MGLPTWNKEDEDSMTPPCNALGIIPARGGSKRLPRKNIRLLAGHPLIAYTIHAARKAKLLTDFLVSSEDEEILAQAKRYGAPTPFVRPAELAGDQVRNIDVIRHALFKMEESRGIRYDILVLLQPTSPVRSCEHIDEAIRLLHASGLDTVASVKGPFKKRDPVAKTIRAGVLEDLCPVADYSDPEPLYMYNASIYAMKRDFFLETGRHVSRRQVPLIMDQFHSVDVDTEADFLVAEAFVKYLGLHSEVTPCD